VTDRTEWLRVKELFQAALELPHDERARLLDEQCVGRPGLRREVESLLAAHAGAGSFLQGTALEDIEPSMAADIEALSGGVASPSLKSGDRLGPYVIDYKLGAGGMGEVHQARDPRLGRDVAIKVLQPRAAMTVSMRERFEREAQAIAALSHPHICAVHDVGRAAALDASGAALGRPLDYLVMERLEGETLAARLAREGPSGTGLPHDEVLRWAPQIADGLDAAHRAGIVHRDLKPANVMLTRTGVKLLDFGLAKLRANRSGSADVPDDRTATAEGLAVGTLPYMAPEQVAGRSTDSRADIFAFGVVLYEMVTGRRPFAAESSAGLAAAILKDDPPPLVGHRPHSRELNRLIRKCLAKDPDERWQSAGDLKTALEWISDDRSQPIVPASKWRRGFPANVLRSGTLLVLTTAAAIALWFAVGDWSRRAPTAARLTLLPEPTRPLDPRLAGGPPVISPDGRSIVYVGGDAAASSTRLYVREIHSAEARPLRGTEDAGMPFFAPDGSRVGFFKDGWLQSVPLADGPAARICAATVPTGASWSERGFIVFAESGSSPGLFRVPASGGPPERLTTPDPSAPRHVRPFVLPDGDGLLYTILLGNPAQLERSRIAFRSLRTGTERILIERGFAAQYVDTGHLVYGTSTGALMAVPFDPGAGNVTGPASPIQDGVEVAAGAAIYASVSHGGSIVYIARERSPNMLEWVTADGQFIPALKAPVEDALEPRLSPDGHRLLLAVGTIMARDLWVYDLTESTQPLRLTTGYNNRFAQWSPDGQTVVFQSNADLPEDAGSRSSAAWQEHPGIFTLPADGSHREPSFVTRGFAPTWVHPSGRSVLVQRRSADVRLDVWEIPIDGGQTPSAVLDSVHTERDHDLSPDGQWIAYASDQSGRFEVWVRSFRRPGVPVRVTGSGGRFPVWGRSGGELFYQGVDGAVMVVRVVSTTSAFRAGPAALRVRPGTITGAARNYDVAPDGRVLIVRPAEGSLPRHLDVLLNWGDELKRLAPASSSR
jgi:serine/threonine-protein kinase